MNLGAARIIIPLLLLTGCSVTNQHKILVCSVEGREVYRSELLSFWKFSNGVWWTSGGHKYQPSTTESCRTEPVNG